jgi:phospholipase/carboxylesterase
MSAELGFIHNFEPGKSGKTLLLLHGTGGDETDLVGLGQAVAPGWALLSPRGKVLEHGAPRFFARLAEGVFDDTDLRFRAGELAEFVEAAADHYGFDRKQVVALGYSNGANIASAMMLLHPQALRAAALLRPMVPFEPDSTASLAGKSVLLVSGDLDPIATPEHGERLEAIFSAAGADVTRRTFPVSHQLSQGDLALVAKWLASGASG